MGVDFERSWMGFLLLLVCGWVALSEGTSAPVLMRIDTDSLEITASKAITESNILEELAESATKNQAGAKAIKGIKGLKVKDIRPPNITVSFIPKMGTSMCVVSQITIAGKSFIGGTMEITVVSNMTTECQIKQDAKKDLILELKKCDVKLISCKTNLPSNMLPKIVNKFLDSTLGKVLPNMMCPAADKVVNVMGNEMMAAYIKQPIGDHGDIQYGLSDPPEISSEYATAYLDAVLHNKDGEKIEIPTRTQIPEDLPPKKDGITDVIISENLLDAFMELFKDDFRCKVSKAQVSSLTANKLAEMIPSIAGTLPPSKQVKAEINLKEPVLHSLGPEKSSMKVHSSVDFRDPGGANLVSLDMVQQWDIDFDVETENLKTTIGSVRTTDIHVTYPSANDAKVDTLKEYMQDIMSTACVPAVSRALAENQMALPSMLGTPYTNSKIQLEKLPNSLMLSVKPNPTDYSDLLVKMKEIAARKQQ